MNGILAFALLFQMVRPSPIVLPPAWREAGVDTGSVVIDEPMMVCDIDVLIKLAPERACFLGRMRGACLKQYPGLHQCTREDIKEWREGQTVKVTGVNDQIEMILRVAEAGVAELDKVEK